MSTGGLFSKPKLPPAPPPPTPDSSAVLQAQEAERQRALKARGRASTILTGAQNDTTETKTAAKKLLGY